MKRFIYSALVLCGLGMAAAAQGTSVLEQLCAKLTSNAAVLDYSYSLNMSGVKTVGEGVLTIQDKSYVMQGNGIKIYCDTSTLWVVDEAAKEVLIDDVDQGEDACLANPVLLFTYLNSMFNVGVPVKDGSLLTYKLAPKMKCGVSSGTITLDTSGSTPVFQSGSFATEDGSQIDVKIKSMTFVEKKPLTFYILDLSGFDSSWMITDLRQ